MSLSTKIYIIKPNQCFTFNIINLEVNSDSDKTEDCYLNVLAIFHIQFYVKYKLIILLHSMKACCGCEAGHQLLVLHRAIYIFRKHL